MKKKPALLLFVILLCSAFLIPSIKADSQAPPPQWTQTYPRNVNYTVDGSPVQVWGDRGTAVTQTTDGGYAVFALLDDHYYQSHGGGSDNYTMQLIKTDAQGQIQWQKTLPQITSCRSVLQTSDGSFIVDGDPYYGTSNAKGSILMKLDAAGNTIWSKNVDFYAFCVAPAGDSGYYMSGVTTDDRYHASVARFSLDGNLLWSQTITSGDWSTANAVAALPDGGAVAVGSVNNQPWLSLYDSQGQLRFEKQYPQFANGLGGQFNSVYNVQDGFVLSGTSSENNAGAPITHGLIAKADSQGNLQWSQTYNNPSNPTDQHFGFSSLTATGDGGFAATADSVIFKVTSDGTVQWYITSASDVTNQLGSMDAGAASSDGGFVVTGGKADSVYLAKFPPTTQASPTPTEVAPDQPATQLFNPITAAIIVSLVAVILGLLIYVRRLKTTIANSRTL